METIKLMTDSASDIPDADLERYNIDMLSIPINVDGKEFYERVSFDFHEYYRVLDNAHEIPSTSRIPQQEYLDYYERNYAIGYEHLINVTISSTGSGTIDSARMAREEFYEKTPAARDTFHIHIVDSLSYSMGYGWMVMHAGQMIQEGKPVHEILSFLENSARGTDVFLGCYTLKYAQRSGRIGAATAFVGELLGMRPIILMKNGSTATVGKVRGDRNVVGGIMQQYKKYAGSDHHVVIVTGEDDEPARELQRLLKKERKEEVPIYNAGACIVTNAGPKMIAIVCIKAEID